MNKLKIAGAAVLVLVALRPHPRPPHEADLTAIDGNQLTVQRADGTVERVAIDAATHLHRGPEPLAPGDLRVGMRLHVHPQDIDVPPAPPVDHHLAWLALPGLAAVAYRFRKKPEYRPGLYD